MKRIPQLVPFVAATALVGGLVVLGTATTATAARQIDGGDVKNSSLTGADIKNGSLTGADIKNSSLTGADVTYGSLTSSDVKNGSLFGYDLRDGSIGYAKLSDYTKSKLKGATGATGKTGATGQDGAAGPKGETGAVGPAGETGPAGPAGAKGETGAAGKDGIDGKDGVDGEDGKDGAPGPQGIPGLPGERGAQGDDGVVGLTEFSKSAVVANVGGKWAENHTQVGTVHLTAGTYLVSVNGIVGRSTADTTAPYATPVFQVQVNKGVWTSDNSSDYQTVTAYTGQFPAQGAAGVLEQNASAFGVITLTEDTTLTVDAFGYNADRSSAGSGEFTMNVDATFTRITVG